MDFALIAVLIVVGVGYNFYYSSLTYECKSCGCMDKPENKVFGTFVGEVFLWGIFIIISIFSSIYLLLIVPLLYTFIRASSSKKVCSGCGSDKIKSDFK